jgi:tartrate dehydratase beta subunit/fumarate hydratase class I family protein
MYVRNMDSTRSLWKQRGQRFVAGPSAISTRLSQMISEFERALRGTPAAAALALQGRIRSVRSKQDLWHLRADVHALVVQAYDKWEAQTRLDELDELFDASRR